MDVHGHDVLRHRENEPELRETDVAHRFLNAISTRLRQAGAQDVNGKVELHYVLM